MKINNQFRFKDCFDKGDESRKVDFLVIHHTQAGSIEESVDLYKEHEVSAHYLINQGGEVFSLVQDCDVAYHSGVSNWNGVEGLNSASIGIELICDDPFEIGYSSQQMDSLIELCKELKEKHGIQAQNIVGHSDIAYCADNGFLDRKQDPSHLFDWKKMASEGMAVEIKGIDELLENIQSFVYGMRDVKIAEFKKACKEFGYKVSNLDDSFDDEMRDLVEVFERRFVR